MARIGWGMHQEQYDRLRELITANNCKRVIEFGSGLSTHEILKCGCVEHITSFDHMRVYAYDGNDSRVDLKIRRLVKYSDEAFDNALKLHHIDDSKKMLVDNLSKDTKAKNTFYNIETGDINGFYDFCLLDGPFGNGRGLSFIYLYGSLKNGSIVFIDDLDHYNFDTMLFKCFDCETMEVNEELNYGVYKVIK